MDKSKINSLLAWIVGEAFTTGVLALSKELMIAFLLGIAGGLGGLFVKVVYDKIKK